MKTDKREWITHVWPSSHCLGRLNSLIPSDAYICVGNLTIIGSDNGLSPGRHQAIIWTNTGILLIGPLVTNFSEILIEILTFTFKKMCLKVSSAKWRPFCLGLNVLKTRPECTFLQLSTIYCQFKINSYVIYFACICSVGKKYSSTLLRILIISLFQLLLWWNPKHRKMGLNCLCNVLPGRVITRGDKKSSLGQIGSSQKTTSRDWLV